MSLAPFSLMDFYPQPCWPQFSFPPSPTDTVVSDLSYSPPPQTKSLHVFCDAPIIAPKPLPYHSPTFLQFDLLPSLDDNLSFPPYTQRPQKRKREDDLDTNSSDRFVMHMHKRRAPNTTFIPPRPPSVSSRHHRGANSRHHHHHFGKHHHPYHAQR